MTYQQQFIATVAPGAVVFCLQHKISAALMISQGCDESDYGKSSPGNNLFGIKADAGWTGATTTQTTREFINGKWITIVTKFRAYETLADSMTDYGNFLLENSNYKNLVGASYVTACNEIAAVDHYATDPTYGPTLLEIIKDFDLAQYDSPVTKSGETGVVVEYLQERLNAHGVNPPLITDGNFGQLTENAVKAFQTHARLSADGVVGPQTWAALN